MSSVVEKVVATATKNKTSILAGLACLGVIGTAIVASKDTIKAIDILYSEKYRHMEKTPKNVVKTVWKCYIPTITLSIGTISAIIGGHVIDKKQQAALTAAHLSTYTAYADLRNKFLTNSLAGAAEAFKAEDPNNPRATQSAQELAFAQDLPMNKGNVRVPVGNERLYLESTSSRFFISTPDKIYKAESIMNKKLLNDGRVSVNDWYDLLGLDPIGIGDDIYWDMHGKGHSMEIYYDSMLNQEEMTTAIVLNYQYQPKSPLFEKY